MSDESNEIKRRDFLKVGLGVGGALAAQLAFPARAFAATNYLTETFDSYNLNDGIVSAPANQYWKLFYNEADFNLNVAPIPCSTCHMKEPYVGTLSTPFFARDARMDPNCDGSLCMVSNPCQNRQPSDFDSANPLFPCNIWNCSPSARTQDRDDLRPADPTNYQAYINVAFRNIGSIMYSCNNPAWDHLGIFIHVKRDDNDTVHRWKDYSRFGCCMRLGPSSVPPGCGSSVTDDQRSFMQLTNPVNPYSASVEIQNFAFPGPLVDGVIYTLGVSITPYIADMILVTAAVQNQSTGAITNKSWAVRGFTVDWIVNPTKPALAIGFASNCGAEIHVDSVVAQNLP